VIDEVRVQVFRDDGSASGSIQVVTNVARLRIGIPSRTISFSINPCASWALMPIFGSL
jgi:hypothetical protein